MARTERNRKIRYATEVTICLAGGRLATVVSCRDRRVEMP